MAAEKGAEAQIDQLINKRSTNAERARESLYATSVKTHYENERRAMLGEKLDYHLQQADRLEGTMTRLIADHRAKAAQITDMLEGREPMPPLDLAMRSGRAEVA